MDYLGISYEEVKYYITQGKNLYKQYRAAKKRQKEQKKADEKKGQEEAGVESHGSKINVDVDVELNPDLLMAKMKAWMNSLNDGIYNGFIVFQILDTVKEVKEVIATVTDVSLESLAYSVETLEDVIRILDEIGLGDDSTAVDLSMIPALNINAIYASFNSLKDIAKDALVDAAKIAATSVDVNGSVTTSKTYDITTDKDSMTITVTYYVDPTKKSVSKKVYNSFSKAKNQNKEPLFSQSECKVIQDTITKLWTDYQNNSTTEAETKAGKYTIKLVLDLPSEEDKSQSEETPDRNTLQKEPIDDYEVLMPVVESKRVSQDKINEERKRNTIKLLHTLYSILKAFVGPFKLYVILINNYKTNKAYVRSQQDANLVLLMQEALAKLGFRKSLPKKTVDAEGNVVNNDIYVIRTLGLYEYVTQELYIWFADAMSEPISDVQKEKINEWLAVNDPTAREIEDDKVTRLFIDNDSLEEQRRCLEAKRHEYLDVAPMSVIRQLFEKDCAKVNGTFDGMDLIEQVGDQFIYADSKLPRLPSQIMSAKSKKYPET